MDFRNIDWWVISFFTGIGMGFFVGHLWDFLIRWSKQYFPFKRKPFYWYFVSQDGQSNSKGCLRPAFKLDTEDLVGSFSKHFKMSECLVMHIFNTTHDLGKAYYTCCQAEDIFEKNSYGVYYAFKDEILVSELEDKKGKWTFTQKDPDKRPSCGNIFPGKKGETY